MTYGAADEASYENPIKTFGGFSTEHMAGAVVIGALVFLILVGRGFRGLSAGGVHVGVR
jgi:hypothetical protein